MFQGSIPHDLQRILVEHVKSFHAREIYFACAGNFVTPALVDLAGLTVAKHANDVTLYSSAIGTYAAGKLLPFALNPEYEASMGWLNEYMANDEERLATILLASRIMPFWSKDESKVANPYYARMFGAYVKDWPKLHAQTLTRVQGFELRLDSYTAEDAFTWIDKLPRDQGLLTYPPFIGGATAYMRDFENLERLFLWDAPSYEPFKEEQLEAFYEKVTEFKHWAFASNREWPAFEEHLRGSIQTTNRSPRIRVYASGGRPRFIAPHQSLQLYGGQRLQPGQVVGDKIELVELSYDQFAYLRSQYMNMGIRPGQASYSMGVLVDGLLVGVFAYSVSPKLVKWDSHIEGPHIYMLSDFPVRPTSYPRLSKLVLYAALSKEAQLLAERISRKRIRSIVTTAFSKNPISMKYRGLFNLLTRKEVNLSKEWAKDLEANSYYQRPYDLNYGAKMGQWSLAEGLAIWKKKHGKFVENAGMGEE